MVQTFFVPLHGDSVSLEEALVGQGGAGTTKVGVLVDPHKGGRSLAARYVDSHLQKHNTTS